MIRNITRLPHPSLSSPSPLTTTPPLHYFSTDTINIRVPLRDPSNGRITDEFIHQYRNPMYSAYMEKRRFKRSEIWPKIHVLNQPPENEMMHIRTQRLYEVKKLLEEDMIKKIVQEDPTQINTIFIISLFSQDHFKQLIDEYVSKVLVCGKAPSQSTHKQMQQIQRKTLDLYRQFYFGQKITPLQRQIQINYLASKQAKYFRSQVMKKNVLLKCVWREQDQRLLEDHVNWPVTDINLTDLSYRPFYEPLNITSRLPFVEKFHELIGGSGFLEKWNFNKVKKSYSYSIPYLNWVKEKLFSRVIQYSKCLQFTHNMKIPADFTIELLVLNVHIWLIIDRLKQFNTQRSRNLQAMLQKMFQIYINDLLGSMNIRKQASAKRSFNQFLSISKNVLNAHFNKNQKTKSNPYISIDALVWSVVMKEKTERYAEEVYAFSEYLVKNWQHMKNFSEDDIFNGICEFDCYLMDPDYKEKILEINPPLLPEQFQQQFMSDKENKSYYYSSQVPKSDDIEHILSLADKKAQEVRYSFLSQLRKKMVHFFRKYASNTKNYDHFSLMDEQKRQMEKKDKTSPWKSQIDQLSQVEKEFEEIQRIKRERRRSGSNLKEARSAQQQKSQEQDKPKDK